MTEYAKYRKLSPTDYAVALERSQFMDIGIKELWPQTPTIAGPAFCVQLSPGDNLMFHAAIYEAPAGSIIVADAGDTNFAVAGGNVCAVAQHRGIAGFVIDGVIRDFGEIREIQFPVFSRGVIPIPGKKKMVEPLNKPINCGGIRISPGDNIVADEEGIVAIPLKDADEVFKTAKSALEHAERQSLDDWEKAHQAKINSLLGR
jgi:regulator of RNase E activity RraA